MSKLFDTLEKIQEQEDTPSRRQQKEETPAAGKTGRYFPFLLGVTIIVAIIAIGQHLPFVKTFFSKNSSEAVSEKPVETAPHVPPSLPGSMAAGVPELSDQKQVEYYNNHAVSLTQQGDVWTALYYFDKASKLAPRQPEPLINMAIILTQLDLGFPASRLFRQAYELTPDNDYLLQAIDMAIAEQVLPPDFYETIPVPESAGE